jgi:hypothetical protein
MLGEFGASSRIQAAFVGVQAALAVNVANQGFADVVSGDEWL